MPKTASRAPGLDTLRSLAIVAVIAYHLWAFHWLTVPAFLEPIARAGWMGVDLFFVLSGYLIAAQLFRPYAEGREPSLWRFYRNRLLRILPAYLAVLALYYFVPGWPEAARLAPAWQYLTFTFNLVVDFARYQGFSHVWSLCVEEHFYLLLPLIVLALMRRPSSRRTMAVFTIVVVAGMALRGYFFVHLLHPLAVRGEGFGLIYMERLYYPSYSRLDGLLAGVALAAVRSFRPQWWSWMVRRGHLSCALGVVLTAAALVLYHGRLPVFTGASAVSVICGYPLLSGGLACLVASALSENSLLCYRIPGAELCATLAYTLYLTHKALMHLVDAWFPGLANRGWLPWLAVYAVACVAVAAVLHGTVERPFLKLRERLDRKTSNAAEDQPA